MMNHDGLCCHWSEILVQVLRSVGQWMASLYCFVMYCTQLYRAYCQYPPSFVCPVSGQSRSVKWCHCPEGRRFFIPLQMYRKLIGYPIHHSFIWRNIKWSKTSKRWTRMNEWSSALRNIGGLKVFQFGHYLDFNETGNLAQNLHNWISCCVNFDNFMQQVRMLNLAS